MDRPDTCIILDKKYNIANSSCHFGSYGSIWTGPSPKKYYMDLIYCHMTRSDMNYLLFIFQNISCILKMRTSSTRYAKGTGLRCSRTVALIVPFFLVCVYGNTKDHKSNGSAATGPPCNDL